MIRVTLMTHLQLRFEVPNTNSNYMLYHVAKKQHITAEIVLCALQTYLHVSEKHLECKILL